MNDEPTPPDQRHKLRSIGFVSHTYWPLLAAALPVALLLREVASSE